MNSPKDKTSDQPLAHVDDWEESLAARYPARDGKGRNAGHTNDDGYRDYEAAKETRVGRFYRENHRQQTLDFVLGKKSEFLPPRKREMGIWEAMEYLNTLVDESDPDTQLSQIEHLLQTAEAIRQDGHPRWFILVGLIHDLGKILCLEGEPQWAVVGDTFPVGCAWDSRIVYHEFFNENSDKDIATYQTEYGIYSRHCGLDRVHFSWGHDEYLYHVTQPFLPPPALAMIRYHSCYVIHREGGYRHLMNDHDWDMLPWVQAFNPYDLYSKTEDRPDVKKLRPYYDELISEFFPDKISW